MNKAKYTVIQIFGQPTNYQGNNLVGVGFVQVSATLQPKVFDKYEDCETYIDDMFKHHPNLEFEIRKTFVKGEEVNGA